MKAEAKEQAPLGGRSRRRRWSARSSTRSSTASARACWSSSPQAGDALARGIAEVLDRALRERRGRDADQRRAAGDASGSTPSLTSCSAIDERIAEIRQGVWASGRVDPPTAPP